jgi:hypothetical protein
MDKEEIKKILINMHPDWRKRWCGVSEGGELWAEGCGCMGCANMSGQLYSKGCTKEEWQEALEEINVGSQGEN